MSAVYQIFTLPKQTNIDASANILAGAKAQFYLTGTTTPTNVFSDSGLTTPLSNPVVADAAGVWPTIFLNPSVIYKVTVTTSAGALIYTQDPANENVLSQAIIGQLLYPQTAAEISASVTPTSYAYPAGDVRRYGADPTGTSDSTNAFAKAISSNYHIYAPTDGASTYRVDDAILINRDFISLFVYGTIIRKASGSASTRPVIRITGNYCSVVGNGPRSTIQSENAAPHGVLLWGSEDPGNLGGTDAVNSRHLLVSNLRIRAKDGTGSGQTLALLSSQAYSSGALYDGIFTNLALVGGEKQLYQNPETNGNTFNNIIFYETRGYGLYLDGISGGAISDCQYSNFFSDAAVSNTTTYYGRYVNRSAFSNMGGEPGLGSYKDFDATCAALAWIGYDNHSSSGTWAAGGSFYFANGTTKLESISFPAAQVASSDVNTLDDYEEATFTPAVSGTTSAGAGTYATQAGSYTKIGNRVVFEIHLDWSAHTGTGNMKITGLPFASNSSVPYSAVSVRVSDIALTAGKYIQGYIATSTTDLTLEQSPTGGGTAAAIPIDTAGSVIISGSYRV